MRRRDKIVRQRPGHIHSDPNLLVAVRRIIGRTEQGSETIQAHQVCSRIGKFDVERDELAFREFGILGFLHKGDKFALCDDGVTIAPFTHNDLYIGPVLQTFNKGSKVRLVQGV